MPNLISLIGKAARKPPHVVAHRLASETRRMVDRYSLKSAGSWPSERQLLADCKAASIDVLWNRLASQPFVAVGTDPDNIRSAYEPDEREAVLDAAQRALRHEVNLLGSGKVLLGETIQWNCDYKTDHCWPNQFAGDIEYSNLDQPSDVKFPWELSRLQWLLPAGQAYVLTSDEQFAAATKRIVSSWIGNNPYAWSVNWSCTMEAAMRIMVWTYLFHVFQASEAWREESFRTRFLTALYAHGRFTEQYLEYSDVNGNHCTADAAGMVFAGLFFGGGETGGPRSAARWHRAGWRLLEKELPKQVTADGVVFVGSTAYHRLCAELFFLPALYRERLGMTTPAEYRERVVSMARFMAAYTKPTGLAPLLGDADDARTLPLGRQAINDHRYLPTMIGAAWDVPELVDAEQRSTGDCLWTLGQPTGTGQPTGSGAFFASGVGDASAIMPAKKAPDPFSFPKGGYYVMRNDTDHVFIDAAPIGLAGRGGHGHNDCLSFEAVLGGVPLVTDCGSFHYTGSYVERNRFRATGSHNTPIINGEEINRSHGERMLWIMQYDAHPHVRRWSAGADADELEASHAGYQRLANPVTPVRTFRLDHSRHELTVIDRFEAVVGAIQSIEIPWHFDPGVSLKQVDDAWELRAGGKQFRLHWSSVSKWECELEACRVSPSYGVAVASRRLVWRFCNPVESVAQELTVVISS